MQNAKEAAIRAGYSRLIADRTASKLLGRKDIVNYIENLHIGLKRDQIIDLAVTALKRIAFYRPNDVVFLALKSSELTEKQIEELDLFQLSELKKLKDGGFEVKFSDRSKAIDLLITLADKIGDDNDADDFLKALTSNAGELDG
ncbi:MAG: terminase small subunit [Oscillospiraceae bacterium]|nr:terminase small subunit [Oscillospiraceae bacterium]